MRYFVVDSERTSTCYHEFFKGKWDGKTFWKEDSLSIHDNTLYENKGFVDAIMKVIPNYDPFGETEISYDEWKRIGQSIAEEDTSSLELYSEANEWVEDVLQEYGCFTILGL